MAIITTNGSFGATAAVTSTTLNAVADAATFSDPVDGTSLELKVDGKLGIKDAGVTVAKLATDAVTTPAILDANVTFAKLTDVIDSDTMTGATATNLATSESIKAYVDTSKTSSFTPSTYAGEESVTLPNGLIMKFGLFSGVTTTGTTLSFGSAFPTAVISATATGNTTNTITISSNYAGKCAVSNVTTSGMKIWGEPGSSAGSSAYWTAIGH